MEKNHQTESREHVLEHKAVDALAQKKSLFLCF